MPRLYHVTVEHSFYALAESPSEAIRLADEALNDTSVLDITTAVPVIDVDEEPKDGWEWESLVYHNKRGDIELRDAWEYVRKAAEDRAKRAMARGN